MVGKYEIEIYNNRVHFRLEVKRNITIIQGDSATGKTTLIGLVAAYERLGNGSGITLKSEKPCSVLPVSDWQNYVRNIHDHIVFLDENMPFIQTEDFARAILYSDNYYVIIYRDSLPQLPYSIEEIYGIREDRESQKYIGTKRVYNSMYQIYGGLGKRKSIDPATVITEDSNAGYDFFSSVFRCRCVSAGGKAKVSKMIAVMGEADFPVLAIVDGAAFGADMERTMREVRRKGDRCAVYAPESFEYLLLCAGLIDVPKEKIDQPYLYADSSLYASWEQFFTSLLVEMSGNTIYQYVKARLNQTYLEAGALQKIIRMIPETIMTDRGEWDK